MSLFSAFLEGLQKGEVNHHAYGVEGGHSHKEQIHAHLTKRGLEVHLIEHESFGIDESRALQSLSLLRPQGNGEKKYLVVVARAFTKEAQNALLKLFEEPSQTTHFFIIFPSADLLLPTLASRLHIVRQQLGEKKDDLKNERAVAKEFLSENPGARLQRVKNLHELVEKEQITKGAIERFLQALEVEMHRAFHLLRGQGNAATFPLEVFEKSLSCMQYAPDRSSSVKMILETLAVIVPTLPVLQVGK